MEVNVERKRGRSGWMQSRVIWRLLVCACIILKIVSSEEGLGHVLLTLNSCEGEEKKIIINFNCTYHNTRTGVDDVDLYVLKMSYGYDNLVMILFCPLKILSITTFLLIISLLNILLGTVRINRLQSLILIVLVLTIKKLIITGFVQDIH